MKKDLIRYWFSALPFTTALRLTFLYLSMRLFRFPTNFFFSQTGEDVILSYLSKNENGFYLDVGCNEPIDRSNTFAFYIRGWKGITIDANEDLIEWHKRVRKFDTAIVAAVSNEVKEVTFHKSSSNAVSTISDSFYEEGQNTWNYIEKETITTTTLTAILDQYLPTGTKINILTVDVEGVDLEVLQGLDFNKYRPETIIIEAHGFQLEEKESNAIYAHLIRHNYQLQGYAVMNAYFTDKLL